MERLPRLADFAIWGTAAETVFGYRRGKFIEAFDARREDAIWFGLDGNAVALALGQFMEPRNSWEGTVGSLLQELAKITDKKITRGRCWPALRRGLGSSLRRLATAFRAIGMDIQIEDHPRKDGGTPHDRESWVSMVTTFTKFTRGEGRRTW